MESIGKLNHLFAQDLEEYRDKVYGLDRHVLDMLISGDTSISESQALEWYGLYEEDAESAAGAAAKEAGHANIFDYLSQFADFSDASTIATRVPYAYVTAACEWFAKELVQSAATGAPLYGVQYDT